MPKIKSAFRLAFNDDQKENLRYSKNCYQEAQRGLYQQVDNMLATINDPGFILPAPWQEHNTNQLDEDLVDDIRTDFSINTKTIGKTARVGSRLIFNGATKKNAADIAEDKFNEFLKKINKIKSLNKKNKNEIRETIKTAKIMNRIIEDMATLDFLATAIKSGTQEVSTGIASENAAVLDLLKPFSDLTRNNVQTTGDALTLHKKSTLLRKALEKELKNDPNKIHSIEQLDILIKRYLDICYKYPLKLASWEKFSATFSITSLLLSAVASIGIVGAGIAGFFTGGITWTYIPVLAKIALAGFAPLGCELVNSVRNLKHGRMSIFHANLFTGVSIGVPITMIPFYTLAMPHLAHIQTHLNLQNTFHNLGPKLKIGAAENSVITARILAESTVMGVTAKKISNRHNVAYQHNDLKYHTTLKADNIDNQKTLLGRQGLNANAVKNLSILMNYKASSEFKEKTARSKKTKFSNLYVVSHYQNNENFSTLSLVGSKHEKISNTQIGLRGTFGLFLSKEEWEVRRLLDRLKELSVDTDMNNRKEKLQEIQQAIVNIPEKNKTLENLQRRITKEIRVLEKIHGENKQICAVLTR